MSAVWNQYRHTFSGLTHSALGAAERLGRRPASSGQTLPSYVREKRKKEKCLLRLGICFFSPFLSQSGRKCIQNKPLFVMRAAFPGPLCPGMWACFSADEGGEIAEVCDASPQMRRSFMLFFSVVTLLTVQLASLYTCRLGITTMVQFCLFHVFLTK